MPSCVFCNRTENITSKNANISFHRFPSKENMLIKWKNFVNKNKLNNKKLTKKSVLCSLHFENNCFIQHAKRRLLLKSAYPSIIVNRIKFAKKYYPETLTLIPQNNLVEVDNATNILNIKSILVKISTCNMQVESASSLVEKPLTNCTISNLNKSVEGEMDLLQCSTPEDERDSLNDAEPESDSDHTTVDVALQRENPESQKENPESQRENLESQSNVEPLQSASTTPSKPTGKRSSSEMLPSQPAKFLKQLPCHKQLPSRFEKTANKLQQMAELTTEDVEDQYDRFAKHLTSQFRELPLRSFILLQSKIQNLITEEKIENLNLSIYPPQPQGVDMSLQNSTTYQNSDTNYCESENTHTGLSDNNIDEEVPLWIFSTKY